MCHSCSADLSRFEALTDERGRTTYRLSTYSGACNESGDSMPRTVTLVFVDSSGGPIGALAPFQVATPWWPDVAPVVAGARDLHKVEVTVLRLLDAQRDPTDPFGMGGSVTYLVESAARPPNLLPWSGSITEDP